MWELAWGTEAAELEAPVAALAERLAAALEETGSLTYPETRARQNLIRRQVTLR